MTQNEIKFPDGFMWGTATAGHQIEGGNDKSDWWEFEQQGKIHDGTVSGRNIDFWNRYEEDVELMDKLGYRAFRMGVEWSRIEPEDGRFDQSAIDHYRKILEALRKRNIKVCLTIYHWVLPLWFARMGGWEHPKAVDRFMNFAERVVKELGEFPDIWVTLNEPSSTTVGGYLAGELPPEKKSFLAYCQVNKTLLHAHAKCYRMIHELVPHAPDGGPTMAGTAYAYQWVEPYGTPGLLGLIEKAMAPAMAHCSFGAWDESIATGRAAFPYGLGEIVPHLKDSYDFCGVNYYTRLSVRVDPEKKDTSCFDIYAVPPGMEENQMGWQVYPPGFFKTLERVWNIFHKPIYITENGVAEVTDVMRPKYLLEHLAQISRAIRAGIDVRGYFYWSFIDNFEWREGFTKKLGLIECDHADPELKRIPRRTAHLYSDIIRENGITEKMVDEYSPAAREGVFGSKWME